MAEGEAPDAIPFDLTETDRINLAQGDEKFTPHNWEDLREIIGIPPPHSCEDRFLTRSFYSSEQPRNPQT